MLKRMSLDHRFVRFLVLEGCRSAARILRKTVSGELLRWRKSLGCTPGRAVAPKNALKQFSLQMAEPRVLRVLIPEVKDTLWTTPGIRIRGTKPSSWKICS
jgi:hypothetical protein